MGVCHHLKSTLPTAISVVWPVCVSKMHISLILIFILKQRFQCFSHFTEWKCLIHWQKYNPLSCHCCYKADKLLYIFGLTLSNKRYSLESLVTAMHLRLNERREKNIKKQIRVKHHHNRNHTTEKRKENKHAPEKLATLQWLVQL